MRRLSSPRLRAALFGLVLTGFLGARALQRSRPASLPAGAAGWASGPNLVAAALVPALFLLYLPAAQARWPRLTTARGFVLAGLVVQGGLLGWEAAQPLAGAVFDRQDVLATLIGGALWLAAWPIFRRVLTA